MRGVFLDSGSLFADDLDLGALRQTLPQWQFFEHTEADQVRERIAAAQIVITNKVKLDRTLLVSAPQLRMICVAATGTDNVDTAAAAERGIAVANARGYATGSVVQHVFLLLFALLGRFLDYARAIGDGRWQKSQQFCLLDFPITEAAGKSLGIVGYGNLGRRVAEVARFFDMDVKIALRPGSDKREPGRVPFEQLLEEVDVLTLHCPLTAQTRDLIGRDELARMRSDAYLINTARGGLVNELALAQALREGQIAGAAVDVLSAEPPGADHPLLAPDIPNLILTPHVAWGSRESRQRLVDDMVANIEAFLGGLPRNRVC